MGKIPLTNAELVKGLLLSDDGFDANEKRAVANEWDRMEHRLQDDALWCFLTNDIEGEYQTRIDLILDIWLKAQDDAPAIDHTHNCYAVFNHVYGGGHDNGCQTLLRDMWRSCKEIFANLEYWFENRELYHLIGYLVARRKTDKKTDVLDLYAQLSNCDKSELRGRLRTLIGKDIDLEQIPDLTYNDSDKTRNALLLFNLLTLNASTGALMRFPFDRYKRERWDLEHVHATAGGPPTDKEVNGNGSRITSPSESRRMFFEGVLGLLSNATRERKAGTAPTRSMPSKNSSTARISAKRHATISGHGARLSSRTNWATRTASTIWSFCQASSTADTATQLHRKTPLDHRCR